MRPSVLAQTIRTLRRFTDGELDRLEAVRPDLAPLIADERQRRASGESPAP